MRLREKSAWLSLGLVTLGGCSGLRIDTSIPAVEAGDYVLAMSACENTPGGGFDICRVRDGAAIDSSWKLVIPTGKGIVGWEVDAYYRDVVQAVHYKGTAPLIEIPWSDFFKSKTWDKSMDGEVMALVSVLFKDDRGVTSTVRFKGLAKLVVLDASYDRLPIDSGFVSWKNYCKIQYSTAGRGVTSCR